MVAIHRHEPKRRPPLKAPAARSFATTVLDRLNRLRSLRHERWRAIQTTKRSAAQQCALRAKAYHPGAPLSRRSAPKKISAIATNAQANSPCARKREARVQSRIALEIETGWSGLRVGPLGPIPASKITAPMRPPGLNVRGNDETVPSATPGAGVRRSLARRNTEGLRWDQSSTS